MSHPHKATRKELLRLALAPITTSMFYVFSGTGFSNRFYPRAKGVVIATEPPHFPTGVDAANAGKKIQEQILDRLNAEAEAADQARAS